MRAVQRALETNLSSADQEYLSSIFWGFSMFFLLSPSRRFYWDYRKLMLSSCTHCYIDCIYDKWTWSILNKTKRFENDDERFRFYGVNVRFFSIFTSHRLLSVGMHSPFSAKLRGVSSERARSHWRGWKIGRRSVGLCVLDGGLHRWMLGPGAGEWACGWVVVVLGGWGGGGRRWR